MLKTTYDQDDDGVVDAAESAPWSGITGKPSTYPPDTHSHDWTGITGKPAAFPPDAHNHDDRYYTEAEVDDLIGGVEGGGLVLDEYGNLEIPGTLSALTLASTIPDGPTPPLSVTSRKVVPNLNAELWQGFEPADLICIGVQKTVGPSGRDFTSIQSAINWFANKVCIQCSIAVDPGTYSEYITINGTSHAVTVTDLQILGDSRPFAGTSYVHGEPCNRVGASYLGSGSVTLSSSGNSITVTAAGGSPNFNSAGVVAGDTIVCRTSVGGWSTLTISSVSNNVLNCTSPAPGNFNAAGAVLTFLPNRRIQPPSTQNQTLMTIQHNKVNIRGFDILGTSTSHYNVDCSQSVVVGMYHCTVRNGYGLVISYSSHLYNWNQPLSIVNCTYGVIAQQAAMAILCYSYAIGSSQGAGYLAQFGGTIDAYATVACGWAAGYLCQLQAFLKADSSGATKCSVGFQSSYNSYICCKYGSVHKWERKHNGLHPSRIRYRRQCLWNHYEELAMFAIVDRSTRRVIASESARRWPGAYSTELFEIIETETDRYGQTISEMTPAQRKALAEAQVNAWANAKVMEFGILVDELFYTAMVANIGFLSTRWVRYGRPVDLDPLEFVCIHAEAQAYRDSHAGLGDVESQMSPFGLATIQEARWQDMQNGFAPIVYTRRLALEQIKLRPADETLPAALEALVASLDSILQQVSASLQQMQQAVLAARQAEVS